MSWSATLSFGDAEIEIGDGSSSGGFNATSGGIEGWYSTPEAKWALTEKTTAHGAYDLFSEDEILYAARVVTLHLWAEGSTRREVVANKLALLACAGQEVKLLVRDGYSETYVNGYATIEDAGGALSSRRDELTITIECPDPYRYIYRELYDETTFQTEADVFSSTSFTNSTGQNVYTVVIVDDLDGSGYIMATEIVLDYDGEDTYEVATSAALPTPVTYDFMTATVTDGDGNDVTDGAEGMLTLHQVTGGVYGTSVRSLFEVDVTVQYWITEGSYL